MSSRATAASPLASSSREPRTVLVGRAPALFEIERSLLEVMETGASRTVTIVGAPGIGKSRLSFEFLTRARALPGANVRIVHARAKVGEADLGLFSDLLHQRFGLTPDMSEEKVKETVRDQVVDVVGDRKVGDVLFYLGQIMGIRFPDSPVVQAVGGDPVQDEQLRTAIVRRFIEVDAASYGEPLIFALDDVHLAGTASLSLLSYLVDRVRGPVLFLCSARPEIRVVCEGWMDTAANRHRVLDLGPLSDVDSAAVMTALLACVADGRGADDLIDQACFIAGGNPRRLERVVSLFFETGVIVEEPPSALAPETNTPRYMIHPERLGDANLPLSIEEAVYARMALLSPGERELLEQAATMGGVFWTSGLVAIRRTESKAHLPQLASSLDPNTDLTVVRQMLEELTLRDYVLRLPDSSFAGDEEYVFKHNLERESIERLTPKGRGKRYHRVCADWLSMKVKVENDLHDGGDAGAAKTEVTSPEREDLLVTMANHREKGGMEILAAPLLIAAAEKARNRYAHGVAANLYARALSIFKHAPPDEAVVNDMLQHYGDALQAEGRTEEAIAAFREMLTRAYRLASRQKEAAALSRLGRIYRESGELDDACKHLEAALSRYEGEGDDRGIASTLDDLGKVFWLRGAYAKAFEYTERGLGMRRFIGDPRAIAVSLNNLGLVQQDSGRYREAIASFEQALAIRTEIDDRIGVAMTLNNLGTVAQDQRDDKRALALFEKAFASAKGAGDKNRIALVLTNLGETHYRLGDPKRAVVLLKEAAAIADEIGDKLGLAEAMRGLAKAYLGLHEHVKAREFAAQAVVLVRESGSEVQLGVALRSLGEVVAAGNAGEDAVKQAAREIKHSMEIFERIGNDVELARSARVYADVLRALPDAMRDRDLDADVESSSRKADEISVRILAARPVELPL